MRRKIAGLLVPVLVILSLSCTYHRAHFNYSEYVSQMPMSDSAWEGEALGPVAANEAGAVWADCTKSARGTVWILIDETRRMGGNAIGDIRWIPKRDQKDLKVPTCRKAWGWIVLFPALVSPVVVSSRAEGIAYRVDEAALPRAGLYRIPATQEGERALVDRIVTETIAVTPATRESPGSEI